MTGALDGYRVVEFGHYIPGPYAGMLLADQGADVIKVEPPGGDPYREDKGFMVLNRSKKSITVDLKNEEGKEIARRLVQGSDVLIENYQPGVAEKLGIGYDRMSALNPKLIYCSVSGFGHSGPYRDIEGWEQVVASVSSYYTEEGNVANPIYFPVPFASTYAAFQAAYSVTMALYARETIARGQRIDVTLFGAALKGFGYFFPQVFGRYRIPFHPQSTWPTTRFYQGSDGEWFFFSATTPAFFVKFCVAVGKEEWLTDPTFDGAPFFIFPPRNVKATSLLTNLFQTRKRDEWLEFLTAADVPVARLNTLEEAMEEPQILANNMIVDVLESDFGTVKEMGLPVNLELNPGAIKGRSPRLGENTVEILTATGYSKKEIAALKKNEVI